MGKRLLRNFKIVHDQLVSAGSVFKFDTIKGAIRDSTLLSLAKSVDLIVHENRYATLINPNLIIISQKFSLKLKKQIDESMDSEASNKKQNLVKQLLPDFGESTIVEQINNAFLNSDCKGVGDVLKFSLQLIMDSLNKLLKSHIKLFNASLAKAADHSENLHPNMAKLNIDEIRETQK